MISIVVPAHNEEAVIERCLLSMLSGVEPGQLEVVVVCNGCSDATAEIALSFGSPVQVIETDVASKSHALNLGDAAVHGYPRFYVDADVQLPLESILSVADCLNTDDARAAAPRLRAELAERSWAVRAFYEIWTRLPYVTDGMIGSGVYAVSEQGRKRFDRFPDIIADDGYVRSLFLPDERTVVDSCEFTIVPPHSLGALICIKTRTHKGNYQLRALFPEQRVNVRKRFWGALLGFLRDPSSWPKIVVYAYVMGTAKFWGYWKYRCGATVEWERDEESRSERRP